jgi:hypothetical protein
VCENAEINFDRTAVHAPVNGYVTNWFSMWAITQTPASQSWP